MITREMLEADGMMHGDDEMIVQFARDKNIDPDFSFTPYSRGLCEAVVYKLDGIGWKYLIGWGYDADFTDDDDVMSDDGLGSWLIEHDKAVNGPVNAILQNLDVFGPDYYKHASPESEGPFVVVEVDNGLDLDLMENYESNDDVNTNKYEQCIFTNYEDATDAIDRTFNTCRIISMA